MFIMDHNKTVASEVVKIMPFKKSQCFYKLNLISYKIHFSKNIPN